MSDPTPPRPSDVSQPTSLSVPPARLARATVIALIVAAVLLVTVVLPAEHGVDPTGIGRLLGLTEMGEIKVSLEEEAAADAGAHAAAPMAGPTVLVPATPAAPDASAPTAASAPAATSAPAAVAPTPAAAVPTPPEAAPTPSANSHVTELVLAPGEGKEIKLVMLEDARVTYSWSTDGGAVNFDAHADAPGIKYHGYEKGFGRTSGEGVLVAAFDGAHGWFFRNRGKAAVRVTLRTDGEYSELRRL